MPGIHQAIILQDRTSSVLGKIEQQALADARAFLRLNNEMESVTKVMAELSNRGQANTALLNNLRSAQQSLTRAQDQYATGAMHASTAGNNFNNILQQQQNMLPSLITNLVSWASIFKGIKGLTELSDSYASATARIDAMNDGLQTTEQLQEMIYQSAQRSRTSYQDLTKTISKLGANAGQAFGSTQEIVAFGEILNKQFVLGGASQQEIASATLQLTQALGSGVLRGQELNAVFNASPPIIKSIAEYLDVDIGQIRKLAAEGKITADIVKNAMFASADSVNEKFENMPITFAQAWTKFKNTLEKILQPVLKALSNIADMLDKVYTFLGENQYILWLLAAGITAIIGPLIVYNTYTLLSTIATNLLSTAMGKLFIKFALIMAAILIVVGVLIYLWNTNDEVAYWMLFAWDSLVLGAKTMGLAIKTVFFAVLELVSGVAEAIVHVIQHMAQTALLPINAILSGLQMLGAPVKPIELTFADKVSEKLSSWRKGVDNDIMKDWEGLGNEARERNATRTERVAKRQKIGMNVADEIAFDYKSMMGDLADTIGTDDNGGKAVKTTTDDKLISDEDIQLLLDVATRDYKLNYQQVTPQITMTFGDIRENADVDIIAEQLADKLQEIVDGNLEVTPVYG